MENAQALEAATDTIVACCVWVLSLLARAITGICIFVDCIPGLDLTYFVLVLFYRNECLITSVSDGIQMFLEKSSDRTFNESVNHFGLNERLDSNTMSLIIFPFSSPS